MKQSNFFLITLFVALIVSIGWSFTALFIAEKTEILPKDWGKKTIHTPSDTTNLSQKTITWNEQENNISIPKTLENLESEVMGITEKSTKSVVSIIVSREVQTYRSDPFGFFYEPAGTVKRKVGGGTGFFINKDWYILTNKHVVADKNAEYSIILSNGDELKAKVLAYDPTTDLAMIRAFIDDTTPYTEGIPLSFVPSQSHIRIGSFVVAIGNALAEFQNTVTLGLVSGMGRQIEASDSSMGSTEQLTGLIQTDAAINPGNSGGPLINLQWQVIGINTAISAGANGIGFAIPLSQKLVESMLSSVQKSGEIKRAFIGIQYGILTPTLATQEGISLQNGAYVGKVVKNSPAEQAGLEVWDVITSVDGINISSTFALRDALAEKVPGEKTVLKVYKKKTKSIEAVELILGESN